MYDWFAVTMAVAVGFPAVKGNKALSWAAFPGFLMVMHSRLREVKGWLGWDELAQWLGHNNGR